SKRSVAVGRDPVVVVGLTLRGSRLSAGCTKERRRPRALQGESPTSAGDCPYVLRARAPASRWTPPARASRGPAWPPRAGYAPPRPGGSCPHEGARSTRPSPRGTGPDGGGRLQQAATAWRCPWE